MHPYATDSDERKKVTLYLAGISIAFAWFLGWLLEAMSFTPPWWVDTPSVMAFYGLFYAWFDKYGWKRPVLRFLGSVKVPDLNGIWTGSIISSIEEHKLTPDVTITITQSWTHMSIVFETLNSISHSEVAAILIHTPDGAILNYEFLNEPKSDAYASMHMHRGTTMLRVKDEGNTLLGSYYTGRDRVSYGTLEFERVQ